MQSAHEPAHRFDVRLVRDEVCDNPSPVHDENTVGEGEDLVDVGGNNKNGAAGFSHLDENAVDRLDRANIDAAGRLFGDHNSHLPRQLARQLDLLLIAAGK